MGLVERHGCRALGCRAGQPRSYGTCVTMTHPMIRRATAGIVLGTVLALVVAARSEPAARTPAAAPLLWQGRLGTHHVSLFGTIHVPDARVLALSLPVRGAFDRADRVVT